MKIRKLRFLSKEELQEVVSKNHSISGVLKELGMDPTGANYRGFKSKCKKFEIDTSHFTGQGHLKGKTHNYGKTISLEEILKPNSDYNSNRLRERLIKEGIFEAKCAGCNRTEYSCRDTQWQIVPIKLELEHKDGDNTNNSIENLELLCPLCHAYTSTYRGKNKKNNEGRKFEDDRDYNYQKNKCIDCGIPVYKDSLRCREHSDEFRKNNPNTNNFIYKGYDLTFEETKKLVIEVNKSNLNQVSLSSGISRKAIQYWINKHNLNNKGFCVDCEAEITKDSQRCKPCDYNLRSERQSQHIKPLEDVMIWFEIYNKHNQNMVQAAKEIGISDNGLRKQLKKKGLI